MRRPLRILVVALVAGFPLLVVGLADLAVVPAAEARLAHRARAAVESASVEAEIGGFPVVARALALGEVASVDLTWSGVEVGILQATFLDLRLRGVGVDRRTLLGDRAGITGVESGEVRMLIAVPQLSRLFDGAVRVEAGRVRLRVSGVAVDVQVSATNQGLVLAPAGIAPVTVGFGAAEIPCAPTVRVEAPNLVLECSFRGLPPLLRGRLAAA